LIIFANQIFYMSNNKVQRVVRSIISEEEIEFRGKKITRERTDVVYNIPKVINTDIAYQLMFGTYGHDTPKGKPTPMRGDFFIMYTGSSPKN